MSLAVWRVLASQSNCVFDVGAHSGIYSLVAHAANPSATVISFEPFPLNFSRLALNLQANELPVHTAINVAVSNKGGIAPFAVSTPPGYLSTGGSLSSQSMGGEIPVTCVSLDNIVSQNGVSPGLLKIDVEGHELQVIQGAASLLNKLSPDLIIESVFNKDTDEIEALLVQRGYRFYVIQDDTLTLEGVDHLRPSERGNVDMDRLNRFITKRDASEISSIEKAAQSFLK